MPGLTTKNHYRLCASCCNLTGLRVAVFMPRLAAAAVVPEDRFKCA